MLVKKLSSRPEKLQEFKKKKEKSSTPHPPNNKNKERNPTEKTRKKILPIFFSSRWTLWITQKVENQGTKH